jgi:hypothetical protein
LIEGADSVELSERGVNLSGDQQTKTRTALEYFSEQLNTQS